MRHECYDYFEKEVQQKGIIPARFRKSLKRKNAKTFYLPHIRTD